MMISRRGERKYGSISSEDALEHKTKVATVILSIIIIIIIMITFSRLQQSTFASNLSHPRRFSPRQTKSTDDYFGGFGGSFTLITGAKFSGTDHLSFGKY
jgi:hypothetical protein